MKKVVINNMMKPKALEVKTTLFFIFLIIGLCLSFQPSIGQDCNKIPSSFNSYAQANQIVKASTFKLKESVNTSKSSWIRGATYFSCDLKMGFLIIVTDAKEYTHQNVPIEIWRGFKNATSFGSYYNSYIKGRYPLILKE